VPQGVACRHSLPGPSGRMQFVHWDVRGSTMLRVQARSAVTTYRRTSGSSAYVQCAPPHGRREPGSRVVLGASTRLSNAPATGDPLLRSCGTVTGKLQLAPQEEAEALRVLDRPPPNRDPQTSLPSAWLSAFSLNSEEPLLGGGAFAKILRIVERATGDAYAMKVMNRPNFAMRGIEAQIEAEVEAMRRCAKFGRCRHIVRLSDTSEENDYVYIRLEICSCDLLCYAKAQPSNRLNMSDAMVWTQQLLTGLKDLHGLGILHRDIKPENLLLSVDSTLKIADFGWCAEIHDSPSTLAGTFQYMAPEVLGSKGSQTEAVDIWSAGVTVLQLLTGRQLLITYLGPGSTSLTLTDPHQALKVKTARLLAEIEERCPPADDARPEHLSWHCWDLLRWMLIPEVVLRASVAEALSHPWLQEAPGQDWQQTAPELGAGAEEPRGAPCTLGSTPALQVQTPVRAPAHTVRSPRLPSRLRPPLAAWTACDRPDTTFGHSQPDRTPISSPQRVPSEPPSPRLAPSPSPRPATATDTARAVCRSCTGERRASIIDSVATLETVGNAHSGTPSQHASTEILQVQSKRSTRRASVAVGEDIHRKLTGLAQGDAGERFSRSVTLRPRGRLGLSPGAPLRGHATPARSVASGARVPGTGSAVVPSTPQKDALSRTSPADFLKASTPGMPPMPTGAENIPLDANANLSGTKTGDVLLCTKLVMRQWPMPVKPSAQAPSTTQQRVHVASSPVAVAERCRLSPRPYISAYGARSPLTALMSPPPVTPSTEAFRDVVVPHHSRASTFASINC